MRTEGKYRKTACFSLAWVLFLNACVIACAQTIDTSNWTDKHVIDFKLKSADEPSINGRVIALDKDSGCLLQTSLGNLKLLYWEDVLTATQSDVEFKPATIKEAAAALAPSGSELRSITSDHYVVLYRGDSLYAEWILSLYERFYRGYFSYWKGLDVEVKEPEFPLIVNVFSDRNGYLAQAERDKVGSASGMIGYYHQFTNHTVSYDLTETQQSTNTRNMTKQTLASLIRSKPGWERTVATIVHESSHQLAYNSGLQVRLADNPLWLSEGLAMFFEAPDLSSSRGWGGIGKVNQYQLLALKQLSPDLTSQDWITPLIQDDEMFKSGDSVNTAYAQSWALTYFLLKSRPKQFAGYIQQIGKEAPLAPTTPNVG